MWKRELCRVISIDKVGTELAQVREDDRPHCSWIIFEEKVATLDKNERLEVLRKMEENWFNSGRISGIILQIIPFDSQQSEVERWNIYIYIYPMIFKSNEFNYGEFLRDFFFIRYIIYVSRYHIYVSLFLHVT